MRRLNDFLLISLVLLLALPCIATATEWWMQTVDGGWVGGYTSLALDSNGYPHISYYDYTNGDLKYAYWDGVGWKIQTVDSEGDVGYYTSLTLDSNDYPHISYKDSTNADLKYAYWDGVEWKILTVDSEESIGGHTSIALDSNDYPHISYKGQYGLKYAHWDGIRWQIQTVDSYGDVGLGTSIAVDRNDHPHISYQSNMDLKYAYWDGTEWQKEIVDIEGNVDRYTSLALDRNDYPHISYEDSDDLKYAYWDGVDWQIQNVDIYGKVGRYNSLALDSNGYPHISYYDDANTDLKYAYWDGIEWKIQTVDDGGYVGEHTSLTLDSNDYPHISYYDNTNGSLKYATGASYNGPIWYVSTTGNDITGDGSEGNPFKTIQKGIDAASDGHTVLVADGTYKNTKLDFMGKAITVKSENGPESTIIDCENNGRAFQFVSRETSASVVSGFTIRNGFDDYGGGIYCHQSSPTIENNIIVGNSAKTNGGGIWLNYSSLIIKNNIITENSAGGIGGGIYCYWVPSPTIQNNIITGNSAVMKGGGIYCDSSSPAIQNNEISGNSANYGGGIHCTNNSSPTIQNNKIRENLGSDGGGGIYCDKSSPMIQNNEISGNSADYGSGISCYESSPTIINNTISRNSSSNPRDPAGGIASWFYSRPKVFNTILWADTPNEVNVDAQSNITITYSDIQGGWEGEGNINSNPLFVNADAGDYHLQSGSPCINAGTPEGAPPDDIEGNPRDANPDMGAYEYVAPPDIIPPTPNTIAFIVAVSATQIDITSTEATDDTPPVFYRLDGQYYDGVAWVDSGGEVSDYDYSPTRPNPWSDTNLFENGLYRYHQQVKDSANPANESAWSAWVEKATLLNPPQDAEITFANVTAMGMDVTIATPPKPSGTGSTGAYFDLITGEGKGSGATDRGYADDYIAEYTHLNPNTQYGWKVKYRNRDGVETAYNPTEQKRYTLANTPSAPTVSNPTSTTLDVTINPNGNPSHTLFAIYNVTGGYYVNASGGNNGVTEVWQTKGDWGTVTVVNLTPETTYEFKCKAKNGDSIETPFGTSGSGTTTAAPVFPIKILPESQTIQVGDTATINIQIEDVTDLGGFEFKLRYKTNTIEIKESDIQAGVFLTSTGRQVINANPKFSTDGDDTILFYGAATYGDQPPASGTGILATIELKGIGAGTTTLDLFDVQVGDADANPISVDVIDGSLTVESILYGDVSDNGTITAYDASLVLQYVAGLIELSPEQQKAADVTNNGTISALDAALILQYTVGLITKFPADNPPVAPALNPPNETKILTEAIEQLETISLTKEQKQVLEQLKNLVFSRLTPKHTALLQNFPNPFNPETWIPFKLASDSLVVIDIYDIKGKLVRRLDLGRKEAGCYLDKLTAARWDGRSQTGERVASGIYLYTIQAGKFTATRRMVVVK